MSKFDLEYINVGATENGVLNVSGAEERLLYYMDIEVLYDALYKALGTDKLAECFEYIARCHDIDISDLYI